MMTTPEGTARSCAGTLVSITAAFAVMTFAPIPSAHAEENDANFKLSLAGVYMTRDNNSNRRLLRDNTTNASLFNADQFDYDWEPGVDFAIGYHIDSQNSVEARVLWLDQFSASGNFSIPAANDLILETSIPDLIGNFAGPLSGQVSASTDFYSLEANWKGMQLGSGDLMVGVRHANLDDSFNTFVSVPAIPFTNDITWEADNRLYGVQIGWNGTLFEDESAGFSVGGVVKGGIYYNDGRVRMQNFQTGGFVGRQLFGSATDSVSETAAIVEAGLTMSMKINEAVYLEAGYQVLYASGVATAASQVGRTSSAFDPNTLRADASNNVLFHGGRVGAKIRF